MADDSASDRASSPLSSVPSILSRSPSPPPELRHLSQFNRPYPSPSDSQPSSTKPSPAPEIMVRRTPPSTSEEGSPPRKRRKLADPKPRTTERLDLRSGEVDATQKAQLDRLLKVLHKKRKIVVIAGAGISVSAGIPDFRSSNGLFKSLRKDHKLRSSGKDLFDASVYQDDSSTSSFHDMVRILSEKTKAAEPTAFHHLIATLAHEGRLLRLYSQNVDGIDTSLPPLQTQVPLPKKGPWPKTIQLHGGLDKMVCTKCHKLSEFDGGLFNGPVPPACGSCEEADQVRQVAEKRSHGIGRLRPRMVLYNEHNPDDEAIGSVTKADLRARPDAIIVAGTTLKVPGVRRIVREMCAVVKDRRDGVSIWINNDAPPSGKDLENSWDLEVRGPCDEVARHAAMPHWDDKTDYKAVTVEEVTKITAETRTEVVVQSPRKKPASFVLEQLVTPAASPRFSPRKPLVLNSTVKEEQASPSKRASAKRKAEPAKRAPAKKPRQPRQPKKAATKKSKAKVVNTDKITTKFAVSKQSSRQRTEKANKDTIEVIPVQIHSFIQYQPGVPMAPISPQAARNNTSPPYIDPTIKTLVPSSPLSSPPNSLRKPNDLVNLDSRPSSSSSRNGTISPTGPRPNYAHALID